MRPFYKNLKVGDKVLIKQNNIHAVVESLLRNPYLQLPWQYPNYLVRSGKECAVFKRSELKLIK